MFSERMPITGSVVFIVPLRRRRAHFRTRSRSTRSQIQPTPALSAEQGARLGTPSDDGQNHPPWMAPWMR
jgi:hypothetical protein